MSSSSINESPLIALSQNLADIVEKVGRSVVAINGQSFPCSGIHWRKGIIVTSDENIKRDAQITVTLPDEQTVPVKLVGRDRSTDIAIFQLSEVELPVAPISNSPSLKVGHLAIALGRGRERGLFASQGVVSTVGDSWRSMSGGYIDQFIRLDLNFYPGSAGGPLVNAEGQVVGFNTTGPRRSALTIPAATVERVLNQLLEKGHISRGYLGLGMQPVYFPDSLTNKLSLAFKQGLIVVNLEPQGPSDQAGVLLGDILVALNGTAVEKLRDVQAFLEPQSVGTTLKVQLIRGGELRELELVIGDKGDRK